MYHKIALISAILFAACFSVAHAETDVVITLGKIEQIASQRIEVVEGTTLSATIQELDVRILEGTWKGTTVRVQNDISPLEVGDRVNIALSTDESGQPLITGIGFAGVYRLPALGMLLGLFIALVVLFGGMPGLRGLASLAGSLVLIIFVLLPGILNSVSALGLSIAVSAVIIIFGSFITHGFNRTTLAAVVGMIVTVILVGLFASYAVSMARLTGFESEEVLYLTASVSGATIDIAGLLLGGILIGLLGILYDIAISQAISVEELRRASPSMSARELLTRANRIGREHIGALVNTLAIAYAGSSLPLLLLFYSQNASIAETLNSEVIATEIVRILVASIGLVIASPITTLLAVAILKNHTFDSSSRDKSEHSSHHVHETN